MPRTIGHIVPDMTMSSRERQEQREIADAERDAIESLREVESDIREQAAGEQCGWLLGLADKMRDALKHL
ncbi:MAG: hypothetical protein IPK59_23270 [Rhodospirillaceae bacterium]|nr:hypothetical protein [Rhodospirillaceae bacterium]